MRGSFYSERFSNATIRGLVGESHPGIPWNLISHWALFGDVLEPCDSCGDLLPLPGLTVWFPGGRIRFTVNDGGSYYEDGVYAD